MAYKPVGIDESGNLPQRARAALAGSAEMAAKFAGTASSTGGVKVLGDQGLATYQFRGVNPLTGPPTSGTFSYGDIVRDATGQNWVCITGGAPGVWNPANPGFINQLPQTFSDLYARMNAGSSVTFSATPFTLPVTNTTGFPTSGKIVVGTGVPGGTPGVYQVVSYTGTTATSFTGCTITGADVVVPDGQDVFYGKSDLRGGTLTVANQIIALSGVDGRPHDLVLLAARDPSPGHTYGDYDIILTREAASYGVLHIDLPVRMAQDISFGDSLNNKLMRISGGNGRSADQGDSPIPNQSIVFAATILGDQSAGQHLVFKNRQSSSQVIFNSSNGTKVFYVQDGGATVPNAQTLLFSSSNGSGNAYFNMTAGNTLNCTVGSAGARWMNNAFNSQLLTLTNTGSLVMGPTLALSATDGFPYMPSGAGAPTGAPTAQAGHAPFFYDTTNHKLWVYDGGWKGVVLS